MIAGDLSPRIEGNTYISPLGKEKNITEETRRISAEKRKNLEEVLPELKERLKAKGVEDAIFTIKGSVDAGAATEESDLDVRVSHVKSSIGEVAAMAAIREEVYQLRKEEKLKSKVNILDPEQVNRILVATHQFKENLKRLPPLPSRGKA